jgi:hypothetical protein
MWFFEFLIASEYRLMSNSLVNKYPFHKKTVQDDTTTDSPSGPTAVNKGNNKITELRTILQRESQNS